MISEAVPKGSYSAIRDNNQRQQIQKQQQPYQKKMSNDDETAANKNQTSMLKLAQRYVFIYICLCDMNIQSFCGNQIETPNGI